MEYCSAAKREHVWVNANEVDEPVAHYTEWNKSERPILYINAYIWNLERRYWWTYLQGSRGDADIENKLLDTAWEREGGMIWESSIETLYITICTVDSQWEFVVWYREPKAGALGQPRGVGWGGKWDMLTYGRNHHIIVK